MTLHEFIERYPDDSISILSPGGYVNLTPDALKALLEGKSVLGSPGDIQYAREATAKELLPQTVCSATYSRGIWNLLTSSQKEDDVYVEASEEEQEQLLKRLAENHEAYVHGLHYKGLHELVEMAPEIAAVQYIYRELTTDLHFHYHTKYLLQFGNPLKEILGRWLTEMRQTLGHDQLDGALWRMRSNAVVSNQNMPQNSEAYSEVKDAHYGN